MCPQLLTSFKFRPPSGEEEEDADEDRPSPAIQPSYSQSGRPPLQRTHRVSSSNRTSVSGSGSARNSVSGPAPLLALVAAGASAGVTSSKPGSSSPAAGPPSLLAATPGDLPMYLFLPEEADQAEDDFPMQTGAQSFPAAATAAAATAATAYGPEGQEPPDRFLHACDSQSERSSLSRSSAHRYSRPGGTSRVSGSGPEDDAALLRVRPGTLCMLLVSALRYSSHAAILGPR